MTLVVTLKIVVTLLIANEAEGFLAAYHGVAGFESALTIAFLMMFSRRNWADRAILVMLVGVLLLGTSLKAIVSLLLFVSIYNYFKAPRYKKFFGTIFISCITVVVVYLGYTYFEFTRLDLGKIEHGNGRFAIWAYLWNKFLTANLAHKIFGFGYAAGDVFELGAQKFYNAHNIFGAALINLGIVGFLMQVAIFFGSIRHCLSSKIRSKRSNAVFIAAVCMVYINGMANQAIGGYLSGPFLVSVALFLILAIQNLRINLPTNYKKE